MSACAGKSSREAQDDAERALMMMMTCGMHLMSGALCSDNGLGAEGARALAPALGQLTRLEELYLG